MILPNEQCLIAEFGTFSNQKQAVSAGARVSIAYDVCNGLILDAAIGHTKTDDEKEMAKSHLAKLNPHTDILVFDRGYPSLWLIAYLKRAGFDFCFRLSTGWKTACNALGDVSKDIDWTATKRPSQEYGKLKTYNLPVEVKGLRLLSVDLPNDGKEVLLTSLTDRDAYPSSLIKELYHLRWGIEECYKRMKQVVQIEYFSGRTVHAIKQDIHARTVLLNMASMITLQCTAPEDKSNKQKKHIRQINKTQAVTKLKDFLIDIFYCKKLSCSINKLLTLLNGCTDVVRPGRSFARNNSYRYKRKPLNYKGM